MFQHLANNFRPLFRGVAASTARGATSHIREGGTGGWYRYRVKGNKVPVGLGNCLGWNEMDRVELCDTNDMGHNDEMIE